MLQNICTARVLSISLIFHIQQPINIDLFKSQNVQYQLLNVNVTSAFNAF